MGRLGGVRHSEIRPPEKNNVGHKENQGHQSREEDKYGRKQDLFNTGEFFVILLCPIKISVIRKTVYFFSLLGSCFIFVKFAFSYTLGMFIISSKLTFVC